MPSINPEQARPKQASEDYAIVCAVLEHLTENFHRQPQLDSLCRLTGLAPTRLQKTFTRWAGLSPKAFLQAVTLDHAKRLLDQGNSILDTSYELGLSGPSRLHDLFVTHEAVSPGVYKAKGEGLTIQYGFHLSPFGRALVMITQQGLAGLAFADEPAADGTESYSKEALEDMTRRWPNARYEENFEATRPFARRIFDPTLWSPEKPLRIVLIGTDFQIRVWEGLLKIPFGGASTYSALARDVNQPRAARAVGAAVGRNPISFVVPCHRVLGKSGALTGYHWGLTRKRAILGWEAGLSQKRD